MDNECITPSFEYAFSLNPLATPSPPTSPPSPHAVGPSHPPNDGTPGAAGEHEKGEGGLHADLMRVFVPSLMLANYPRQIPASEIAYLAPAQSEIVKSATTTPQLGNSPLVSIPDFSPAPAQPVQVLVEAGGGPNASTDADLMNLNLAASAGVTTTSPPLTLSTFTYPYQSSMPTFPYHQLPLQVHPGLMPLPPTTPTFPGSEYLVFPDTPAAPNPFGFGAMQAQSFPQQPSIGFSAVGTAHVAGDGMFLGNPAKGDSGAAGWNMFRMDPGPKVLAALQGKEASFAAPVEALGGPGSGAVIGVGVGMGMGVAAGMGPMSGYTPVSKSSTRKRGRE